MLVSGAHAAFYTVSNNRDSGAGSLRRAIENANAQTGPHSIVFDISGAGPHTIRLLSPLPPVRNPIVLDGKSQDGYSDRPLIELDGSGAGPQAHGVEILSGYSTVRGLAINRFGGAGLHFATRGSNVVMACFIGTDPNGTNGMGNGIGILISDGSTENTLGGTVPADRNIISGNQEAGIALMGGDVAWNVVQGNYIGLNRTGDAAIPNLVAGLLIRDSYTNTIGGTRAGARNVISGNEGSGILIQGVLAISNVVQANFIGVDATGKRALGNTVSGIAITDTIRLTLGGVETNAGNVISGNGVFGVDLAGESHVVQGNLIGTDDEGRHPIPNGAASPGGAGIRISGAFHTIGGSDMAARNLISANRGFGGVLMTNATSCAVQCNLIGPDATGLRNLSGQQNGIVLINGTFNTIGGSGDVDGNVISGHEDTGLIFLGQSRGNVAQRNFIGSTRSGLVALGGGSGIELGPEATQNLIGGSEYSVGNLVSGNEADGMRVDGPGNFLQSNLIGVDVTGYRPLPNGGVGIALSSSNTYVAGNRIAWNGYEGVLARPESGGGNTITVNAIWLNAQLGIDLAKLGEPFGAVTLNDPMDPDTGPNGLQNFPVLTNVTVANGRLTVQGELNSRPLRSYRLEVFAVAEADASGFGEGQLFLVSTNVFTSAQGRAGFSATVKFIRRFDYISATATDLFTGDTSEFSEAKRDPRAQPDIRVSDAVVAESGNGSPVANFVVRLAPVPYSLPVSVEYTTVNGTAIAPDDYASLSGTLTFAPGETNKTISVPIVADALTETEERFYLRLGLATNGVPVDAEGIGIILDSPANSRIAELRPTSAGITVSFGALAGKRYAVEYSAVVGSGARWHPVLGSENVVGTGGQLTIIDWSREDAPVRFYRLRLLP